MSAPQAASGKDCIILVNNPFSERNKRGMAEIDAALAGLPQIRAFTLGPEMSIDQVLAAIDGHEVGMWVCNSGDGTVQRLLSRLLQEPGRWPMRYFAILPRGMANMTAADVGLRQSSARHLKNLVAQYETGAIDAHVVQRHVLRVDYSDREPPQYGMFFGAAGIIDAIRLCTGEVHSRGLKGEWSHAATIAKVLWAAATKGVESIGIKGRDIRMRLDRSELLDERLLVLLCTTLSRLVLRSRPFWNTGNAPFKITRISSPAGSLVRNAWPFLYGGEPRRLSEQHYRSCGARHLEVWLNDSFTIDGEFFEPVATRPLRISAEQTVPFVRF